MTRPDPPFEGSCLCGAAQVHITAPPLLTFACHCRDCQKLCASTYSLNTMFPSDSFSCTGELITGGLGSTDRKHYFCKSCLSFIYSQVAGAEWRINLRTSVLNDAALFDPFIEVMTNEKVPWANVAATHSFSQNPASPEDVKALMDEYSNRWA